jgi:DNA-binding response OmpR family regulator
VAAFSYRATAMNIAMLFEDPREALAHERALAAHGHACTHLSGNRAALRALRGEPFDLVLLDWALSGLAAVDVLAWIRRMLGNRTAVIVIGGDGGNHGSEGAELAYAAGADACVKRPARRGELLARVSALARHARRTELHEGDIVEGAYRISIAAHRVWLDGRAIALSPKEFGLAVLLFRRIGDIVTRGAMMDAVWKRRVPDTSRTIDSHLSRVRTKLDLWPHRGMRLASIHGAGYRLDALSPSMVNSALARYPGKERAPPLSMAAPVPLSRP